MAKMGRPTDALKHKFARILDESNAYEKFKEILIKTKSDETFMKAFEICHDRAFGKAQQSVDMSVTDESERPTSDEVKRALRVINPACEGDSGAGTGVAA